MAEEKGPSWYDAAVACREVAKRFGRSYEIKLVPNWRIDDATRLGAWVVGVTVRGGSEKQGWEEHASCSFGKAGERTTAPGAILVCTSRLWTRLDEKERLAESQARF